MDRGYFCGKYNETFFSPAKERAQIIDKNLYWHEVIPETVGQYIGLKDKNGKKIFEGDIIQSLETKKTAVVQWFPEHSAFMAWCKFSNEVSFLCECTKIIEVIGNIHDNPELIELIGDSKNG